MLLLERNNEGEHNEDKHDEGEHIEGEHNEGEHNEDEHDEYGEDEDDKDSHDGEDKHDEDEGGGEDGDDDGDHGDEDEDATDEASEESNDSIDSRGAAVGPRRRYPDFTIEQYWGADSDENPYGDVIRVIIEVGSKRKGNVKSHNTRQDIEIQLDDYIDCIGPDRWNGRLLGIGMLGSHVFMLRVGKDYPVGSVPESSQDVPHKMLGKGVWISMFNPKFVAELDSMYKYSMECDAR